MRKLNWKQIIGLSMVTLPFVAGLGGAWYLMGFWASFSIAIGSAAVVGLIIGGAKLIDSK